jgi:hypothetical protein
MTDGVMMAVEVTKISSRVDKTISIVLETAELAPAKVGELFALRGRVAFAYIKPDKSVSEPEMKAIDGLQPEMTGGKSMSKRLRDCLYRAWESNNEGYTDSELYYRFKMEKFIDHVKSKIEP